MLTLAELAGVTVVAKLHRHLDDTPDADGDEAHATDLRHDLLQVGDVVRALQINPIPTGQDRRATPIHLGYHSLRNQI